MPQPELTKEQALSALGDVRRGTQRVIDQVDVPQWYWYGLAAGWIVLGVLTDLKVAWLTAVATLAFGAIHSAIAPHVIDGRRANPNVRVDRDLVGRQVAWQILAGLVALAGVTIVVAVVVGADGAKHPVTIASAFVAVILVLGGPRLLQHTRARLARDAAR
jgi:hypothetical protein